MPEEREPICVIGAGTMGRGITQVALAAGHAVALVDPEQHQLDAAIEDVLLRLRKIDSAVAASAAGRLSTARDVTDVSAHPGTIVIEAVVEDLAVKHEVLGKAYQHFGAGCVLATNTSSLSVTEIAAGVPDPSRVVGMHFFNPVPVMKLVEVVRGLQTDSQLVDLIDRLATSWGKQVAQVRSAPGFIVNRVARAFYGEALRLLEERAARPEVVDELLRAAGFRMGPFELMDLIGIEVNLAVTRTVWQAFNQDPRFAPSLVQSELVAAGRYGRKSGHGFYRYGEAAERPLAQAATPSGPGPDSLVLHGHEPQLEALAWRARTAYEIVDADDETPWAELPSGDAIVITRGRTAHEEAQGRGRRVAVVDRCLDVQRVAGLAIAATDDAVLDAVAALLARAGVRAFPIADTPGLVVGRVLSMIANEAWEAEHHGVASREDIDAAMVLGTNYPTGPFAWSEEWGVATLLETLDNLWSEYRDGRYRASQRLRAASRAAVGSVVKA